MGLEKTFYRISEDARIPIQVCAIVYRPVGDCPVNFTFRVHFSTGDIDEGAGIHI